MAFTLIDYEKAPPVATIWFARPEVRNAMSREMGIEIRDAVIDASQDPDVRVIVYRGRGDDFCAGSDLADLDMDRLGDFETSFDPLTENGMPARFSGLQHIPNDEIPKVTIAVVHGYAVGGGFEFALNADLCVVAEDARMGDCHIRRGFLGAGGLLWNIARMAGMRRMKDLVLTGKIISGRQAYDWGLANEAVPLAELDDSLARYVEVLARMSPRTQRIAKLTYSRSMDSDRETLDVMEQMLLIGLLRSDDATEGIAAFREGRPPAWGPDSREPARPGDGSS